MHQFFPCICMLHTHCLHVCFHWSFMSLFIMWTTNCMIYDSPMSWLTKIYFLWNFDLDSRNHFPKIFVREDIDYSLLDSYISGLYVCFASLIQLINNLNNLYWRGCLLEFFLLNSVLCHPGTNRFLTEFFSKRWSVM